MDDRKVEAKAPLESVLRTERLGQPASALPTTRQRADPSIVSPSTTDSPRADPSDSRRQDFGRSHAGSAGSASLPKMASDFTGPRLRVYGRRISAVARRATLVRAAISRPPRPASVHTLGTSLPVSFQRDAAGREALLVPFDVAGKVVGTIWAMSHDPQREFDAEDLRLLESLGRFASAAYKTVESLEAIERSRAALSETEERFRDLFDEAPIAYLHQGPDTRIFRANRIATNLLGVKPGEIEGMLELPSFPTPRRLNAASAMRFRC